MSSKTYIKGGYKSLNQNSLINHINSKQIKIAKKPISFEETNEFIIDNTNRFFDHDIHLKSITIDELFKKENYPKSSIEDFDKINNNLFEELNKNNNGIIANKSILLGKYYKKMGAGKKLFEYEKDNDDIITYCSNISTINKRGDHYEEYLNTENKFMEAYINNDIDDKYKSLMPEKLGAFIIKNNEYTDKIIEINMNKKYVYNMKSFHEYDNSYNIKIDFSHSGYNEDIVTAFEHSYILNEINRQKFIRDQYEFIDNNLTVKERIILNDYTKKNSFVFYTAYVSRGRNELWFDQYIEENKEQAFCFGDSFYYQIWSIFDTIFYSKTGINETVLTIDRTEYKDFYKYWEYIKYGRVKYNLLSLFYDSFTKDEWSRILDKFILDVNAIILKAPITTSEIYCYRGVNNHYIHSYQEDPRSNIFISGRFSSFSLNFKKSYEYYEKIIDNPNKCIYKTVIKSGVNVLFLPKVSIASDELEILTPLNTVFIYEKTDDHVDIPIRECHNNRDNKYGICSFETKFNCVNVLIDKTPEIATYIF